MIQAARIKPEDRVLEIGAGSGYQTALLAELASQVFAVERHASLSEAAHNTLERLGYRNTKVVTGDGSLGFPEAAPFDAIIVSAASPRIPPGTGGAARRPADDSLFRWEKPISSCYNLSSATRTEAPACARWKAAALFR